MDDILKKHMEDDSHFQSGQLQFNNKVDRILLGDEETGEMGMKKKVDAMYNILVTAEGVSKFFGGIKVIIAFVVLLAAFVALLKGWFKI